MSLRKPYFVVSQCLQPLHLFQVHLLVTLVLSEHKEEVLALFSFQYGGVFWEIWHKQIDEERDENGAETLDDEYPPETFQPSNTVHVANTVS